MKNEDLSKLKEKYGLTKDDFFKHKHYTIIVRQGIEKIQAQENMNINYEVIKCEKDFCVVKAFVKASVNEIDVMIETFGSALYGGKIQNDAGKYIDVGTTQSWYVMEIAEKRAMSRAVLKITGFYQLGVFGEDESDDFKKKETTVKVLKELIPETDTWRKAIKMKGCFEKMKENFSISKENEELYKQELLKQK